MFYNFKNLESILGVGTNGRPMSNTYLIHSNSTYFLPAQQAPLCSNIKSPITNSYDFNSKGYTYSKHGVHIKYYLGHVLEKGLGNTL